MKTVFNTGRATRTPVMLVCGRGDSDAVTRAPLPRAGTLVIAHAALIA